MKTLFTALVLLPVLTACAKTVCQTTDAYWTNCIGKKGPYVGDWKDNKYHGQGTYTWGGEKYVGEFKDGEYNGQGTYTFPDGEKYVGEF